MENEDAALVERCRNGDLAAFEPLVEKYRQRAWRLAYSVLRDREEALDAAQEAFIRAYQALPNFRGQSAFYTWLFRIVMNVATDRARARAARGRAFGTEQVPEEEWDRVMVEQSPDSRSPDQAAASTEERERITRALDTLPANHKEIIVLSDVEGLSYREIAEVLSIPMGTVMSRLHNARKKLKSALGPLLALLVVLLAVLAPAVTESQQVVRFGARVLVGSDAPLPAGMKLVPPPSDERLDALMPKLRRLFSYKEYTSVERYRAEVPIGSTQRWSVPGDRVLEVVPEGVQGDTVRMRVRLLRGPVTEVTTEIRAARGNPAVIGGPRYGDGTLIVVLWANANPEPHPERR